MEHLEISQTEKDPGVSFNPDSGVFIISGNSIPEDCLAFYKPIFAWLDDYIDSPALSTKLEVRLKFFNTSTSKCLFSIFKRLEKIQKDGGAAGITWHYSLKDTDMYESGMDFSNMLSIPFKLIRED